MSAKSHRTSTAILVVGMHRSGTSALTRVLNLLGCDLGTTLLPPGKGNAQGHWENAEAVAIHETLLSELGTSWDDTRPLPTGWMGSAAASAARERIVALIAKDFAGSKVWAFKDPRLCRLLPLWMGVLDNLTIEPRILFSIRNPAAVVESLKVRNGFEPISSYLRWVEHIAEPESVTRASRRAIVLYDDLLSDWTTTMARARSSLSIRWPRAIASAAAEIEAFLAPGERHNFIEDGADSTTPYLPATLYSRCAECARGEGDWRAISVLVDDYRRWSPVFLGDIDRRGSETKALIGRLRDSEEANLAKDAQIANYVGITKDNERKVFGLLETVQGKDVQIQNRDTIIYGKDAEIQRRDELLVAKEAQLQSLDDQLRDKDRQIFGLLETVQGKDVQIQNRDTIIQDKDTEIRRRDQLLATKEAKLQSVDDQLRDKDRQIFGLLETVHGKDIQIQNRDEILRNKDAEILRRDERSDEVSAQLLAARQLLRDRENQIETLELRLGTKENLLQRFVESSSSAEQRTAALQRALHEKDAHIAGLVQTLAANNADLARLAQRVADMHQQLGAQSSELAARAQAITAIQSTVSWRLTRPLRAVRHLGSAFARNRMGAAVMQPFLKTRHVGQTLRATFGDPERRQRYLTLARVLGPRAALHHTIAYLRRGGPRPRPPIPVPVFDLRPGPGRRAVILTTPHCDFVAASIRHALEKIGVESHIIHGRPEGGYEDLPHFVICPQMFEQLPGLYVAFQMEQSVSTRWFTDAYIRMLENSFAILDYSVANIEALVGKGLQRNQFFYLPLDYLPDYGASVVESGEYDVVFYGDINNDRRRQFVDALEKVCSVKVFNNLFGDALHAELAKAKLIVNIHYYEGALLETTRLWECISLGKLVVSERAVNMEENRDLDSLVDFVDLNDVDGMVERVRYWLANESARVARIKANRKVVAQQPNRFEYFFYRFLLAWDAISFHRFWELAGSKLTLPGDRLCLNLPEWFGRRRSFDKDNHYGFSVFPGLRHHQGWVGCGMSYKLMIMLARKQRIRQVAICEDDVEFREGFGASFEAALLAVGKEGRNWDVLSGFLGDLHADATVSSVRDLHDRKLVLTNKLISMVLNVYNRTIFDRVALWDERDRNVVTNTIDRYLERTCLAVWACQPFLVGHKAELHSTLWGIQNGEMDAMIQRSELLLAHKVDEFMAKAQRA